MRIIAFLSIIIIAVIGVIQLNPTAPENVNVLPKGKDVEIVWVQTSYAKEACISKNSQGHWVHIGCIVSVPGLNMFSTEKYVDAAYKHSDGDTYNIHEYYHGFHLGDYVNYQLCCNDYMPLITKENR